jgi:hypothetical protein
VTAQRKNIDALKHYRWTSSTTMKKQGEKRFELEGVNRINETGELVQDLDSVESTDRKKRGLRGRRQRKATARMDAFLEEILAVSATYVFMSTGRVTDFIDKAKVADGEDTMAGTRKVHATDVSLEGDSLTKWIDPESLWPQRIEFSFAVDGHAVTGEAMYRPIEDGPNVPRMLKLRIVDMDGIVETEFFDYRKQL